MVYMRLFILTIAIFMMNSVASIAAETHMVDGYWVSEKQDIVVKLSECDEGLCGFVSWLKDPADFDVENPDEALRDRPVCNLKVLGMFDHYDSKKKTWQGGNLYKFNEGSYYGANVSIQGENTLHLRGYVGLPALGRTVVFTRVTQSDYPVCHEAQKFANKS